MFWNVWLHIVQGVVVGGSDGLGLGDCLEVDEGGVSSATAAIEPGIGTAGRLVAGGLSVLGETMELFLADVFIFSLLLTRGSGVITEECLFGCVKKPRGVLLTALRWLRRV